MEAVYENQPLSLAFAEVKDDVMKRAVRVKTSVKEKINRFLTFIEAKAVSTDDVKVEVTNEVNEISNEDLSELVNGVLSQKKVPAIVKRVVLYTKSLYDKVSRITEKTLSIKSNVINESVKVEEETNNMVPDTWDKLSVEPIVTEPVTIEEEVVPEVKEDVEEPVGTELNLPVSEPETVTEEEVKEPDVVPSIMPNEEQNLDFTLTNLKPLTEETDDKEVMPTLPDAEISVEQPTDVNLDFLKSWNPTPVSELENKPLEIEEKDPIDLIPTQSAIMAKVKRARNELEDEKVKNASLQDKVQVLEGSNKDYKDKIGVLESFVKDVVKENSRLTSENSQLKIDKQKLEERVETVTSNSASELDRQTKSHAEEIAKLKDRIISIEEQHVAEKDRMNEDFARKIEISDKRHKEAMNALYSTISEALGESTQSEAEEEYTKAA